MPNNQNPSDALSESGFAFRMVLTVASLMASKSAANLRLDSCAFARIRSSTAAVPPVAGREENGLG
eukprot:SAG31_NODE_326_length_17664_cov_10.038543_8_plen_66_part_00